MTTTSLPPHPWSSDIKEYFDLDGASVGTVGYVYDAHGVELAVVYRMLDHPAVLPLLTAAPEMKDALVRAVETIRAMHGIGLSGPAEDGMWKLYQQSPEMKAINAAIAKAEGAL